MRLQCAVLVQERGNGAVIIRYIILLRELVQRKGIDKFDVSYFEFCLIVFILRICDHITYIVEERTVIGRVKICRLLVFDLRNLFIGGIGDRFI